VLGALVLIHFAPLTHGAPLSPVIAFDLAEVRQMAEAGDPQAQDRLAEAYYYGVERARAVEWFRRAAEQDVANSQWRLGTMLLGGVTSRNSRMVVERNPQEAVRWFFKAADQGHAAAQVALADCYFAGTAVATNWIEAYKWYLRAAEQASANGRAKAQLLALSMTSDDVREGQRLAAIPGEDCEICRRLLEVERNPGATLELKGITGFPKRPLALISGQVFAPGEEAMVKLGSRRIRVECLEIRADSVSLRVEGKVLELALARVSP
jgi:hypothetical protein